MGIAAGACFRLVRAALFAGFPLAALLGADVKASVTPAHASLLLGQSFVERFKSWSIDNTTHELLLELRENR
jgi:hypothetical protein